MIVGEKNIIHQPLVVTEKIILPPLHMKLGILSRHQIEMKHKFDIYAVHFQR